VAPCREGPTSYPCGIVIDLSCELVNPIRLLDEVYGGYETYFKQQVCSTVEVKKYVFLGNVIEPIELQFANTYCDMLPFDNVPIATLRKQYKLENE
jgi:hypothetical protein